MKTELGQVAKDVITNFTGTVTGKVQYFTGCEQSLLVPKCKADGEGVDGRWFDDDRLEVINQQSIALPNTANGPDATPTRSY